MFNLFLDRSSLIHLMDLIFSFFAFLFTLDGRAITYQSALVLKLIFGGSDFFPL